MFDPPVTLDGPVAAVLADPSDPTGHAVWVLTVHGSIYGLLGAAYHGGATGQPYFAGRTAKDLVLPTDAERAAGKVYVIVDAATPPERYAYP